ncbi:tRNA pseudouridine(38-40) synthase TruA [Fodinicurvata sp. EGI_FJ10296]|uniref:tRNA pseudouridine(38-40) synthase TruA n=1 Tax=Fodinicurvata sp. EGI_FJ10296 TaxID=3231908 RepID=UPI0034572FD6
MTRYKLTIEYDGRPFVGWQRQANGQSIQETLETAIHKFCGEQRSVQGAGRTDSGVHALGQVAHVDIDRPSRPDVVRDAINFHLRPAPVAVIAAEEAPPGFNARTSALQRRYLYRVINRRAPLVLDRGLAWQVQGEIDIDAMRTGAAAMIGHHDFTSFRASECQASSPMRTMDSIRIIDGDTAQPALFTAAQAGDEIVFEVKARSFLQNQVRIIVGTLIKVGQGRWDSGAVARALAARERAAAGPTAPADGLYFADVAYPKPEDDQPNDR